MTCSLLKYELLHSVGYGALETAFLSGSTSAQCRQPSASPLGLIARIRLWLRLIWGAQDISASPLYIRPYLAPNRTKARLNRRTMPLARQGGMLEFIIYRSRGRAAYLRFIYDRQLTGRVRWCFTNWNWRWAARICFSHCGHHQHAQAFCNAPLFPD